jgi:hypothetical protein
MKPFERKATAVLDEIKIRTVLIHSFREACPSTAHHLCCRLRAPFVGNDTKCPASADLHHHSIMGSDRCLGDQSYALAAWERRVIEERHGFDV